MLRRSILLAGGGMTLGAALVSAPVATAQTLASQTYLIGILEFGTRASFDDNLLSFKEGLREAGLVEGRNLRVEYKFADNDSYKLKRLADDLVRSKVQLIYAPTTLEAIAAKSATSAIPIVFSLVNDPVGVELVASLAKPGGNITGVSLASAALTAKRVQLMREMFPGSFRFGVIYDEDAGHACQIELKDIRKAAKSLMVDVREYPYQSNADLDKTFENAQRANIAAALVPTTYETRRFGAAISSQSAVGRLPMIYAGAAPVEAGGLMSFGPQYGWAARRAASFVAKILAGAKPADLAVEQPSRYELIVNLKAARALGVQVPQAVLLRADRVIE